MNGKLTAFAFAVAWGVSGASLAMEKEMMEKPIVSDSSDRIKSIKKLVISEDYEEALTICENFIKEIEKQTDDIETIYKYKIDLEIILGYNKKSGDTAIEAARFYAKAYKETSNKYFMDKSLYFISLVKPKKTISGTHTHSKTN